jgi:hypothetical protein
MYNHNQATSLWIIESQQPEVIYITDSDVEEIPIVYISDSDNDSAIETQ